MGKKKYDPDTDGGRKKYVAKKKSARKLPTFSDVSDRDRDKRTKAGQFTPGDVDLSDFAIPEPKALEKAVKKHTPLSEVVGLGQCVEYIQHYILPQDQHKMGWVLQNANCPGGQTDSYVVTSNGMLLDMSGVSLIKPIRIKAEQIIRVVDTSEIFP